MLVDFGFELKKLLSVLILPPGGLVLWFTFSAWLCTRRRRLGMVLLSLGIALFFAMTLPVVARLLQAPIEAETPPWQPDRAERLQIKPGAIVILGGGTVRGALEYGGETLKNYTLRRVRYGARLARQTHLPILVTGGRPEGSLHTEAVLMDEALRNDFGLSARWLEDRARDTRENAIYSIASLHHDRIDSIILVTDVDHMPRARHEFETRGIRVVPAATNYLASAPMTYRSWLPSNAAFSQNCDLSYEWLGRVWQGLREFFARWLS